MAGGIVGIILSIFLLFLTISRQQIELAFFTVLMALSAAFYLRKGLRWRREENASDS